MDSNKIYTVILDQREELPSLAKEEYVYRPEADLIKFDNNLAQVVIGVRRSGKSTLCHLALCKAGIKYGYVNFDDDRLANLTVDDLNNVLEAIYRVYGREVNHILFDEIQNVDGWHLFINRLLRRGLHPIVTGSNAKLLSSELATHLTGRYNEIKLYPFSFRDFCLSKKVDIDKPTTLNNATIKNTLVEYLLEGGFPEMSQLSDKRGYVGSLLNAVIMKDIKTRFHIKNGNGLRILAYHLLNNSGQIVNIAEMVKLFNIGSDKTVRKYLDYLAQAFLIISLPRYSYKSSERMRNQKAYVVDTGMLTYHSNSLSPENYGWRLENVVLLELLRRSSPKLLDVYYYRPTSRSKEVDFVVAERGNILELIQVSYDVSSPKTLGRELAALVVASRETGCKNLILIACTDTRKEIVDGHEIHVISVVDWLLNRTDKFD